MYKRLRADSSGLNHRLVEILRRSVHVSAALVEVRSCILLKLFFGLVD